MYLFDVIPTIKSNYITRNDDKPPHFKAKHNCFKNPLSFYCDRIEKAGFEHS